ncbi:copper resistance CopC family protein [Geodermatophilus sp. SYSU D00815]
MPALPLVRRSAVLVVAVLAVLLATAPAARAHTALASSTPAEGSTVAEPLPAVDLTFTGPVLLRQVAVRGPDGADAAAGAASAAGAVVSQPVALAAAGTYTVDYSVTSADGHQVDGSVTFTYAPPAPPTTSSPPPATTPAPTSAAEPSEAAAEREPEGSGGLPAWLLVGGAAALVAAVFFIPWRRRRRG